MNSIGIKNMLDIELKDHKYTIVEGNLENIYRIDDSQGDTVLRFDKEESTRDDCHVKNADDELIGIIGRHKNTPEIPEGHDGNYVIYSVTDDTCLASIILPWTTGEKVTQFNNSDEIVFIDMNHLRRFYRIFTRWPMNALLTRKLEFKAPNKGEIGKLESDVPYNPLSKRTNELTFGQYENITDFEKFCVMALGIFALY